MKRSICDACHKYTEPHGSLCEHCIKDNEEVVKIYNRLREVRPELRGMTLPQAILHVAKHYVGAP